MELVSKPKSTADVWEHFGFKPNDRGEPQNLNEPVCRICHKTVSTKSGNTTNLHLHLKHNHPLQFSQLGKKTCTEATEGPSPSCQQSTITGAFARQTKYKRYSAKWCSPLTASKSRHFGKCGTHLTASTNCLGKHMCHKLQFHNCTTVSVVCGFYSSAIFLRVHFIYCYWLFCLFILDICNVFFILQFYFKYSLKIKVH